MSQAELSDFEDNLLPNDNDDASRIGGNGYGSDEAVEDTNFPDDDETDQSKKRRIDPTSSQKRTVRNSQPKLNAEVLKGPKGIQTIEKYFEDFKYSGKGHEKKDLNRLMKKLEYWSHRLFPKFEFDDCLAKLETLGGKKPVQTHLTKIRLGLLTDDDVVKNDSEDENEIENLADVVQESVPVDAFDALIAEEIEKQRVAVTPQRHNVCGFPAGLNETPKVSSSSLDLEITADIKERMERNRQIAIHKRLARIEAEKAKTTTLPEKVNENGASIDNVVQESAPINEFVALISEEPAKEQTAFTPQGHNVSNLTTGSDATPTVPSQSSTIEITADMKEKMEKNRQIAIQKRLARIEAEEAKKRTLLIQESENEELIDQKTDVEAV